MLVTGNDGGVIQQFISSLNSLFVLKELGDLSYFLGVYVRSDASTMHLSQTKYFIDLLKRAEMFDCKSLNTPMNVGTVLSIKDGDLLSDAKQYRSIVGALQYCLLTRPNLTFSVNKVY